MINSIMITVVIIAAIIAVMIIAPEVPEMLTHKLLKRSKVLGNMRTCQRAAVSYSEAHGGSYPRKVNDVEFKSYFPGGNPPDRPGSPLVNPFTGVAEWPKDGDVTDIASASQSSHTKIGGCR